MTDEEPTPTPTPTPTPKPPRHPNSLANLRKPFAPGNNANPTGKTGPSLAGALKEVLQDRELLLALARSLVKHAATKGDARLYAHIFDRLDGSLGNKIEVSASASLADAVLEVAQYEPALVQQIREHRARILQEQADAASAALVILPPDDQPQAE